jgi:hypothetical protein
MTFEVGALGNCEFGLQLLLISQELVQADPPPL